MPNSKKKDKKKNRATAPDLESVAGAELNGSLVHDGTAEADEPMGRKEFERNLAAARRGARV